METELSTERFAKFEDRQFVTAAEEPISTFAAEADSGAYTIARRMIREGQLPPRDLIRIEEFLNAFDYADRGPNADTSAPFAIHTEVGRCPWNTDARLLRIGLKGRTLDAEHTPPRNLVFLLDVSGSMNSADKLGLVKSALTLLTDQLVDKDHVSIVVYAGASGVVLEPTSGGDNARIREALDALEAGGSTNGGAGIQLAYDLAQRNFDPEAINRVILCTDGDFNVGTTSLEALEDLIVAKRDSGVFLTVFGVGRGNIKDDTMEMLARKGNGHYAYLDSEREARRVLVEQAGGSLVTIAKDVKIQVEFSPEQVTRYRLIGYVNRHLENRDFADDTKDAGELGAGHSVVALYEFEPTEQFAQTDGTWVDVRLRYKEPDLDKSELIATTVAERGNRKEVSEAFDWACAVATFGLALRGAAAAPDATLEMALEFAQGALGEDPYGHRHAFVETVQQAMKLRDSAAVGAEPR